MSDIRLSELRDLVSRELTFPVTCKAASAEIGDVRLQAPGGDGEAIRIVLDRCETREFASPDELFDSLLMRLSEEYVGRKGYDDRSTNAGYDDEVSL